MPRLEDLHGSQDQRRREHQGMIRLTVVAIVITFRVFLCVRALALASQIPCIHTAVHVWSSPFALCAACIRERD